MKYDRIREIEEGYSKLQHEITSAKSEVSRLENFGTGLRDRDDKIKECAGSIKVIQRYMEKLAKECDYLGKVKEKS